MKHSVYYKKTKQKNNQDEDNSSKTKYKSSKVIQNVFLSVKSDFFIFFFF